MPIGISLLIRLSSSIVVESIVVGGCHYCSVKEVANKL